MIYVNDCSIRVVESFIKIFVQEIFVHTKIIYNEKKQITVYLFSYVIGGKGMGGRGLTPPSVC